MPEGLEVEIWRRAATRVVGRSITGARVDPTVAPPGFVESVVGEDVTGVRRAGKILLFDTTGPTIGLHFGMTGRLVIDGNAPIERLEYASGRDDPSWDRVVVFGDRDPTPMLRLNDPRRLGRVSLDEDVDRLGVDFSAVTPRRLAAALAGRRTAIKAALLDQHVVAGLGNLCADEVLWWAGLDPHRGAGTLTPDEIGALARSIRRRLPIMLRRGGSHTGTLSPAVRSACPPCQRDGHPLRRDRIAGRTAVWCPHHQR